MALVDMMNRFSPPVPKVRFLPIFFKYIELVEIIFDILIYSYCQEYSRLYLPIGKLKILLLIPDFFQHLYDVNFVPVLHQGF